MKKKLTRKALFNILRLTSRVIPEHRNPKASNLKYPIEKAVMTAFGVFFLQQPSLLANEKKLKRAVYFKNFKKLFHEKPIESSQTLRNILDPINPEKFSNAFDQIFKSLDRSAVLEKLKFNNEFGLLLSGDGVDYFYSEDISCENCSIKNHKNGITSYAHKMFNVGIVHPSENYFIPLYPEFITPQDGNTKQDCEQNAAKRWLKSFRKRHKTVKATLQMDNLNCNHKFLSFVLENRLNFMAVCKPKKNKTLYEWVETARKGGDTHVVEVNKKVKGKFWTFKYEYLNDVPMRDSADSLKVNYISIQEIDPIGKIRKKFEYVTNIQITDKNIETAILAGRKRWKVENEGHNVLKNQGYYFDHNYVHGKKHLSAIIAMLILFAFLTHTILKILDQEELAFIFKNAHSRRGCFELLRGIVDTYPMQSWEELYIISMKALEAA